MEILNKGPDIWVKIKNGGKFIAENVSAATKVLAGVVKEGKKPEGKPHPFKGIDTSKETVLYIYFTKPDQNSIPDKAYKFEPGKTIYITWNPQEKVSLYPQTGPALSFNKTASGLSLSKNVVVTPKENNITDITLYVQNERIGDPGQAEEEARRKAAKLIEKKQNLDSLWRKWCDPKGTPEHPSSLLCAAGMGNSFALLVLRLRFVTPEVNGEFKPEGHVLKLVGDNLPPQGDLNLKRIYHDLLGKKSEKKDPIQWKDFDAFVKFLTKSKDIAEYVNKSFLYPYGLSTEDLRNEKEKKSEAENLNKKATSALTGYIYSAPAFPATSIVENKKYLSPSELFKEKCEGAKNAWNGTLFCAIGEGNLSATYLAQMAFVKPTQGIHAISIMLNSVAPPNSWVETGLGLYLGNLIKKLNDKETPAITWEDLRNTLITKLKDFTETVPFRGNGYMTPYGIEIAP